MSVVKYWTILWRISIAGVGFGLRFGHGFPIATVLILGADLHAMEKVLNNAM